VRKCRAFVAAVLTIGFARMAVASGHGPVFGLATPTNVKGGWSLDIGTAGRVGTGGSGVMPCAMLSYGITQDLQISISAPAVFISAPLASAG